jgi:TPR repeat protein
MKPLITTTITLKLVLCSVIVTLSACASLEGTSPKPEDRDRMLSESKCALSLKRSNNFVKYWPPVYNQRTFYLYTLKNDAIKAYDLRADLSYYGCAGAGLQPDKVEAAKWYLFAANLHVPEAQFKLGKMMVDGDGIPKDEAAGMEWIVSAALEQDSIARDYLKQRNIAVPTVSGPNTYERIKDYYRQNEKQKRAEFWSDLGGFALNVVTLAAVSYAVVDTHQAPSFSSQTAPSTANSPTIYRYRPAWCTSNVVATGGFNVLTGTVTTFCN